MVDDLEIARKQLDHAWSEAFGDTPIIEIDTDDGILTLPNEGVGIARSPGGGWHDWYLVVIPATRREPEGCDVCEGETVDEIEGAVRALVQRALDAIPG